MHVHAVADDLGRHLVVLEHGAGQAGRAMAERRHAIEEVRRVTRAGADALERLFVRRAGMSERHVMPVRGERANERQRAVELRRNRHDADVGPRRRDLGEDFVAGELALGASVVQGAPRQAQALERLRAAIVRVDEVAFEMRRQHAAQPAGRASRAARTAASIVRRSSARRRPRSGRTR